MTERSRLLNSVSKNLLPVLETNGFEPYFGLRDENSEMKAYSPFGHFRRFRDTNMQCVDLNFGKLRNLGFYIAVASISERGVSSDVDGACNIPQLSCIAEWGRPHFRITPQCFHFTPQMFKMSQNSSEKNLDKITLLAASRLREGLRWFEDGSVGWHMRKYD